MGQDKKIIYSDGDIESVILNTIDNPVEFQKLCGEPGAVFHNFTKCRENLINWYPFKENSTVLEIGAGMGALTGCLCDRCGEVVAIEESSRRAEIILKRHKKYSNLKVISDNIYDHEFNTKFDYILLIGVLEYVGINNVEGDPYARLLNKIRDLLKDDGVLLLAIENKFGLKYWCGAAEDHTGKAFDGINDYKMNSATGRYSKSGVRTFSRDELYTMLKKTGYKDERFYYPLPDYKFPSFVFSDQHLPDIDNIRAIKFTYPQESELIANEKELYKDIIDNNIFPFFANSFLVEASKGQLSENNIVFVSHKRDYKVEYNVSTLIDSHNRVNKVANSEEAKRHLITIQKNRMELYAKGVNIIGTELCDDCKMAIDYSDLPLAIDVFNENAAQGNLQQVKKMLGELEKNIYLSSEIHMGEPCSIVDINVTDEKILDRGYIDMTFINSFYDEGQLIFFDQEWCLPNIPVKYILYRAVKYSKKAIQENIAEILYNDFGIYDSMRKAFDAFEMDMINSMMNKANCSVFDPMMYHDGLKIYPESRKAVNALSCEIREKNEEIDRKNEKIKYNIAKIDELENTVSVDKDVIAQQNVAIQQRDITINNQRGHIEQLLEVDRHYQNIVRSKGWRLVSFPGRVFEKLYPVGTPRRRRISNVVKYVKAVNITNIKFVANAFRKGGMKQVRKEMNAFKYRCNNELPSVEPQIWEVDEITDLSQCDKLVFKKWDAPKVSIVIPVYNQFTYTYNCLKSILENSGDVSYEIIIADDVSNDLTTRLSEIAENIQIARNKENQRFLRNCNQAAKYAKGEYILFLNNDTQVQENWLQPLVELIERDDSIGMVGSKLIYPDGSLQEAGGIIWGDGHAWNYGNGQNANKPEFNYVKEVDYISGAAIMIRTSLWEEIGGFDKLFAPAYCEDSDLAFEVRKHGYKLMYQPASVVVHFEGKSNGTDLNTGVKSYQVENSKKLAEKWKEEFARQSQTEDDLFHARERSQNKKTILVIDHYVPQFDKDAGSKTTWQYLKMFVKQGYNVKFMGDNFFQDDEYTPVLEQYGIEVLYGPWYAENYKQWIIDNQDNIDFVYLNRPHITEKYIDFIKNETNIKCIYYGHDLHFLRIFREYELCKDETLLQESEDWKRREFAIMKQADINYYPSYVEVDEIHKVDSSIPAKAITAYVYEEFRDDISLDFAQKNGILFVGGFGHPPNEDAVLWFAKEVYPLITKKQDIPFYIVGSNATDAVKRLNSKNIIVKGFVTEEELKELYDTCKLVVVPLRYGAGVKGKVVEALYYGTPMVTTTVGIEGIKGAEEFMEVADEPEEFAQKVLTLYNDNDRLVKTVEDYQKYIKAHNSIDAVWDIVKEDFQ